MEAEPDLGKVAVDITCELGRRRITVAQARVLKPRDTLVLNKLAGDPVEVRVNGRLFALGEIVVVTGNMAVRLTSLAPVPPGGTQ